MTDTERLEWLERRLQWAIDNDTQPMIYREDAPTLLAAAQRQRSLLPVAPALPDAKADWYAIPSAWLKPGACVPVTPETVGTLLHAVRVLMGQETP